MVEEAVGVVALGAWPSFSQSRLRLLMLPLLLRLSSPASSGSAAAAAAAAAAGLPGQSNAVKVKFDYCGFH